MNVPVGLALVGRTPRPDFLEAFTPQLGGAPFEMMGALDPVDDETVVRMHDPGGEYPIHIPVVRPGGVDIPVSRLRPYIQDCVRSLEAKGSGAVAILCAGDLGQFSCSVPLLSSGRIIPGLMRSILPGVRLGIVTPIPGQIAYAAAKWAAEGFDVGVEAVAPYQADGNRRENLIACARKLMKGGAKAIVLDCFGFRVEDAQVLYRATGIPAVAARDIAARSVGMFCGYLMQSA